jgi:2,3,4,5-tetrahydropyridine-2-carboxylate N-succinyltransferase
VESVEFLRSLEKGEIRAAKKESDAWVVNPGVKRRILEIFQEGETVDLAGGFQDVSPLVARTFCVGEGVRIVPGGSAVRSGAHIGKGVVMMPPSYVNVGAYVGEGSMIDSHVLVGSCAQIGRNVHLSAAVQIGGVLEPVGDIPVIIEDGCFIGAGSIIVEGCVVREGAVIAPGVALTASVPIYDNVNRRVYRREIPEGAVVVPGSRGVIGSEWADGLCIGCAVIIKYRDGRTDESLQLEEYLR